MSQASKDYARKARIQSLDTIAVRNHTADDYSFWHDKYGSEKRKFVVPKAQKDIGHGKGINFLPRFAAQRYVNNMIVDVINKIADEEWAKRKKEIRMLSRAEQLQIQEKELPRTNDMNLWYQYMPAKNNLNKLFVDGTSIEEIEEAERAFRKEKNVNIPVVKLLWLGLVSKYEELGIEDLDETDKFVLEDPFK